MIQGLLLRLAFDSDHFQLKKNLCGIIVVIIIYYSPTNLIVMTLKGGKEKLTRCFVHVLFVAQVFANYKIDLVIHVQIIDLQYIIPHQADKQV